MKGIGKDAIGEGEGKKRNVKEKNENIKLEGEGGMRETVNGGMKRGKGIEGERWGGRGSKREGLGVNDPFMRLQGMTEREEGMGQG